MTLNLYQLEGEHGYVAESLDQLRKECCLSESDVEDYEVADPGADLTITYDMREEPELPEGARLSPGEPDPEHFTRVTMTVSEWIEHNGPGEIWCDPHYL